MYMGCGGRFFLFVLYTKKKCNNNTCSIKIYSFLYYERSKRLSKKKTWIERETLDEISSMSLTYSLRFH